MTPAPHILGVILAGGRARRLFPNDEAGGDKGLTHLGGDAMLAHVIASFRPQVSNLIINANGDPARFKAFGLPVVPDQDDLARGPLAGILAAMAWAQSNAPQITALATVSTDVPFLPPDLVTKLSAGAPFAIAASADRRHPAIGLWPLSLKPAIEAALAASNLSLNAFASHHAAIAVSFPFSETGDQHGGELVDPFFNVNTPADLEVARRLTKRT